MVSVLILTRCHAFHLVCTTNELSVDLYVDLSFHMYIRKLGLHIMRFTCMIMYTNAYIYICTHIAIAMQH